MPLAGFNQTRNGWRSIYDKSGQLSRMLYYSEGQLVIDSSYYYQYYTENLPKAIVQGEVDATLGCVNGSIRLFDQTGMLTAYHIKRNGDMVFDTDCDYYGNCTSVWKQSFEVYTGSWNCNNCVISDGNLVIQNENSFSAAIYKPQVNIDLSSDFSLNVAIPKSGNSANQGIALGWRDSANYFLVEILFGQYYAISNIQNGKKTDLTGGRKAIEENEIDANIIQLVHKGEKVIVEINGTIQYVSNDVDLSSNKIALITRSKGNAQFAEMAIKYELLPDDNFYNQHWVGKGTGFFISNDGKILTTNENIMDGKRIRVRGKIGDKEYVLPAKVIIVEESENLAILQVDDPNFKAFDELPFGYNNHGPASDSKVFCLGFPNAVSGIYMDPDVFEGKVLAGLPSSVGNRMLELDFRNGMVGAPVFDWDFCFLGIVVSKGNDLWYTEMKDFFNNERLFKANFGTFDKRLVSPHYGKTYDEKYAAGKQLVVIVETTIFDQTPAETE